MKVRLKRKHITKGMSARADACPIALAIREKTHRHVTVSDGDAITLYRNGLYSQYIAKPTKKVTRFIRQFDITHVTCRKRFKPFTFTLVPVTE